MDIFQILETTCSTDVSSCCSDYGIAMFLYTMKKALDLIHLVVPFILLVMGAIQFIKMMITPDDKKNNKTLLNKFLAAIFVFFTPFAINLILGVLPDGFEISACWKSADGIANTMKNGPKYEVVKKDKRKKVVNIEKYKLIKDPGNDLNQQIDTTATGGKKIVDYALQFVGNPYVLGGNSLTNGCDCSHFVYLVLKDVGAYNGKYTTASNWVNLGEEVKGGLKNAQAGDIVVYKGHIGIYDGSNYLIEAKGKKYGITHDRRPQDSKKQLLGVRRFV
ncbi:MAG: C40 family peptidase [Bacilli bacterium]|nr:C40 family peptidase [Bacilli bacterium]